MTLQNYGIRIGKNCENDRKGKTRDGAQGTKKTTDIAKVRGFYLEYRAERRLSTHDKRSASNYYYLNATF